MLNKHQSFYAKLRLVLVLERVHRPRVQFFEAVVVAVKDLGIHGQR